LSYGVQWEIARFVTQDRQNDFSTVRIDRLDSLKGSNVVAAPKVVRVMRGDSEEIEEDKFSKFFENELSAKVCLQFKSSNDSSIAGLVSLGRVRPGRGKSPC
jgi:hypothetical protein